MRVKMTFAVLALAALALSVPASSAASVIRVDPGESIQAAIDKAKPGTTIKLGEGTYKDSVNISKSDIEIVGEGRSKTKIEVPAAGDLPAGKGCVDDSGPQPVVSGFCISPDQPSDPKARCENSPSSGPGETIVKAVDDVEISRLAVTGFTGIGILYFCADDPEVTRVYAKGADHSEYGIAAFASEDVLFARNLTVNSGEAGIYIGDSPHADATVWKNVSWNNGFGLFLRDSAHGKVLENKTFGNCLGILVLNTDESQAPPEFRSPSIDARDWLVQDNDATANNRACPGGEEGGPISGIGIAVSSSIDIRVIGNDVFGNDSTAASDGHAGIVVLSEGGLTSRDVKVAFNTAFGNTTDIVWDQQPPGGGGNRFFGNDCLTSQPDGLCEDPDDNGNHGDDNGHGNDHPKGGGRDDGDHHHKGDGDHKKHKKDKHHKKHKKSKKHDRHND